MTLKKKSRKLKNYYTLLSLRGITLAKMNHQSHPNTNGTVTPYDKTINKPSLNAM
jgi:hypothetical protein